MAARREYVEPGSESRKVDRTRRPSADGLCSGDICELWRAQTPKRRSRENAWPKAGSCAPALRNWRHACPRPRRPGCRSNLTQPQSLVPARLCLCACRLFGLQFSLTIGGAGRAVSHSTSVSVVHSVRFQRWLINFAQHCILFVISVETRSKRNLCAKRSAGSLTASRGGTRA